VRSNAGKLVDDGSELISLRAGSGVLAAGGPSIDSTSFDR